MDESFCTKPMARRSLGQKNDREPFDGEVKIDGWQVIETPEPRIDDVDTHTHKGRGIYSRSLRSILQMRLFHLC